MPYSDELDDLILEYKRLAEEHDSLADELVAVAMRRGWDSGSSLWSTISAAKPKRTGHWVKKYETRARKAVEHSHVSGD